MNTNIKMLRLKPRADLKQSIKSFCEENAIQSGAILSAVGSLSSMNVRIADGRTSEQRRENMELISLSGTITDGHIHAHIAAINGKMEVFGGHLLNGCIVNTTMELVIGDYSEDYHNSREHDENTGYDELVVSPR
jgi:predicted DNA-binding protein with PD1-like motif